jgi:hypothetical protein
VAGGIGLLDLGLVCAVGGNAVALVERQSWGGVWRLGVVDWATVAGFSGIVGWVRAVDRHSSPPSVGTQFRIRLILGNGSGSDPVQVVLHSA